MVVTDYAMSVISPSIFEGGSVIRTVILRRGSGGTPSIYPIAGIVAATAS